MTAGCTNRLSETVGSTVGAISVAGMKDKSESVLWLPAADRVFLAVVAPAVGGAVGFFLPRWAPWAASQKWIPFQGVFEFVASWSHWWVQYLTTGIGVALGAVFVAFAFHDSLRVVVSASGLRLTEEGRTTSVARADASTVFVDGKELVVLDAASRQVVRAPIEEKEPAVERAFVEHGYSFVEGDPYESLYQRWIPGSPTLPADVDAVMRAREMALQKKSREDASELREALDRLGIVVRERKSTQYWRPLVRE